MEKGIVDIYLSNDPSTRESNRKNKPNSSGFNHRAECLSVINTLSLMKALSNKPGFVSTHRTIRIMLNPINPLATNNVCISGSWNQTPSLVSM
ncbi:hypothetical protein Hanom_Chr04g00363181 [Helianthus anomalus]